MLAAAEVAVAEVPVEGVGAAAVRHGPAGDSPPRPLLGQLRDQLLPLLDRIRAARRLGPVLPVPPRVRGQPAARRLVRGPPLALLALRQHRGALAPAGPAQHKARRLDSGLPEQAATSPVPDRRLAR
jgi:hypothetical protein